MNDKEFEALCIATKFLSIKAKSKHLDQKLNDKAKTLTGIIGYVANLDIPDEDVITYYHRLFVVEATFRMLISNLKVRPILHRKRDAIKEHLTIVFAVLAISRIIEYQSGITIKQFVKVLRPIRSGIVTIIGKEFLAEPEIHDTVKSVLNSLDLGH